MRVLKLWLKMVLSFICNRKFIKQCPECNGILGCKCGKGETTIQAAPTTPAPSAQESAADIYKARLEYDPKVAQQEMDIQTQFAPQQAALYSAMYQQYLPEYSQAQQDVQKQLYPYQSQLVEQGAQQALERLQNPMYMTSQEQAAQEASRGKAVSDLQKAMRERANLGGGLYGGRTAAAETQSIGDLLNQFQLQDYTNRMTAGQAAQQALTPYMQILYPQVGTQQPQTGAFQYTSAVPSADNLYNAMFQASQPQQFASQKSDPTGALIGAAGTLGAAKIFMMCVPEGTVIDMENGNKNIEDVRAGDIILDKNGNIVKVLMKYEFDELPTDNRFVEYTYSDGTRVTACDKHIIDTDKILVSKKYVSMNNRSYDILTTGEDGSYRSNGIGLDSMIPYLHKLTKELLEV